MIKIYGEAVSRHYGYLLVNFKPGTTESQRLKTDILPDDNQCKKEKQQKVPQISLPKIQKFIRGASSESDDDDDEDPLSNMPSCEDCGRYLTPFTTYRNTSKCGV
jgi:hypothetical protein